MARHSNVPRGDNSFRPAAAGTVHSPRPSQPQFPAWKAAIRLCAAARYASDVFLAGCVVGTLRELVVVPLTGRTMALALELPIMVVVCLCAAAKLPARIGRFSGATGIFFLVGMEDALARLLGNGPVLLLWSRLGPADLLLTLAGLAAFMFMPVLASRGRPVSLLAILGASER